MQNCLLSKCWCASCLVALFLTAGLLPVQAEDGSPSAEQLAALLRQLDAKSRQLRVAAENDLLKFGPAALDALPPPDLLPNVAVREAVRRIRTKLERVAAEQSIAASRVTLSGELTIQEIVAAIAEQTGNAVVCSLGSDEPSPPGESDRKNSATADAFRRKLTVDWKSERFWAAISQLEAAGLRAAYVSGSNSLELIPVTTDARSSQMQSQTLQAFRIDALPVELRAIDGMDSALIRVPLRVLCEPRLRPLFLRCSMSDLSLTSGRGLLKPFSPESRIEIPLGDGGREAKLELSFLASQPDVITDGLKLSGRLTLLTAALEREITFPKLSEAKGLTRRRGGVTVTVTDTHLSPYDTTGHAARISTRIGYDSGARAFESHQTWVFHNRVFLRDSKGQQYAPNDGFSTLFQGDGTVGVEYRFGDLPKHPADWSFTYVAPTLLIDVPLDVSIDGITPPVGSNRK